MIIRFWDRITASKSSSRTPAPLFRFQLKGIIKFSLSPAATSVVRIHLAG